MAIKINEKTKRFYVYGKYKNSHGQYESYYKQTDFTSKKQALAFDKEYKKELESKILEVHGMKLFDLIDALISSRNYSQSALAHFNSLKNALEKNNIYLNELNVNKVNRMCIHLSTSNVRVLKAALNFGYKYRYIQEKLADFIIPKKRTPKKEIELFNETSLIEDGHIFRNSNVALNDIVLFLLDTGLRINECLSITFDRIHEDHIVIDRQYIYDKKLKQWRWDKLKSKASYRKVALTARAKEIIKKQLYVKDGFLFGGITFMQPNNIQKFVKKYYNTHCHAFRHTCASNLIVYSYDVLGYCDKDSIAQFMGHDVKELERTYKHLFRDKGSTLVSVLEYAAKQKK